MNNSWKKEFKNKMESWQEPVPDNLWADICNRTDLIPKHKKIPRTVLFFRTAGIAAACIIVAAGTMFFMEGRFQKTGTADTGNLIAETDINLPDDVVGMPSQEISGIHGIKEISSLMYIDGSVSDTRDRDGMHRNMNDETTRYDTTAAFPEDSTENDGENSKNEAGTSENNATDSVNEGNGNSYTDNPQKSDDRRPDVVSTPEDAECDLTLVPDYDALVARQGQRLSGKRRFSINASVSGTPGGSDHTTGYGNALPANASVESFGADPSSDIRLFNRTREVNTDTKYMQPIRAGVTFRWYFADRWSLESGISWSWLHSRTTSGSEQYYCRTVRNLHYIGIPVRIGYDFWKGNHMKAYISAEAMAEKCVAGSSVSRYIYNGANGPEKTDDIREKQLQWSVSAMAGFQYDMTKTVSLYIEPGASWHIPNGSGVDNVYKARQLDFSLGLGVRFSF